MSDDERSGAQEAEGLRFTHRFLTDAVRRGELHPLSFDMLARRIDERLVWLGELPATPAAAPGIAVPETFPELPAAPGRRPAAARAALGPVLALYLGAFLLFMSAVAFTAYGWQSFADELKFVIIAAYDVVLFGISVLVERTKLRQAALTFFWLGAATLPIAVGAFGSFVLGLPMRDLSLGPGVGNEWLAFLMAGTAAGSFALWAWRRMPAFRVVALVTLGLSPLAYFLHEGDLVPVIPAAVAVAYTAAAIGFAASEWSVATKAVSIGAGAFAAVLALPEVLEHLGREVVAVQAAGYPGVGSTPYTATVCVALLALLVYLWRRAGWTDSRLPEALLGSVLVTLLLTAWRLGDRADGLGLVYLAALLPAAVYVGMKRYGEAVVALPFPLLALVLLTPIATYERLLSPGTASSAFLWDGLLLGLAGLGLGDMYGHSAWYRKVDRLKMAQASVAIAVPAVYVLLAASLPPGEPWLALAMTAVAGVLAFLAFRLRAPGFAAGGLAPALVALVAVLTFTTAQGVPEAGDWAWLAAFFGILTVAALAVSFDERLPLVSSVPAGLLATLTLLPALAAFEVDLAPWAFLGLAGIALAWAALYRFDLYAVAGVLLLSVWASGRLDETLAAGLDAGLSMLLHLPAFVLGAWWWRRASGAEWRAAARSLCLVAVPLLALGSLRAGSYVEGYPAFVLALAASAAFAVAGFAKRFAGFALVGTLSLFSTSFEFLAPYIELIPSWVGFAVVGLLLVGLGIWWERGRVYLRGKARDLSRGWV